MRREVLHWAAKKGSAPDLGLLCANGTLGMELLQMWGVVLAVLVCVAMEEMPW